MTSKELEKFKKKFKSKGSIKIIYPNPNSEYRADEE
jgi:hypothetical protein